MEKGGKMMAKKDDLKSLILGILNECGEIPKVKLAKLILFSEIEHFKKTGHSITNLYFVRLKRGPVIAFFDDVLEEHTGTNWNKRINEIPIHEEGRSKQQFLYSAAEKATLPLAVQETVNEVCREFGKKTGTELSVLSHQLPAWKYSEPNEPIFVSELTVETDKEYFEFMDLVDELEEVSDDDEDRVLGQELSRNIPAAEIRV
jgi:uncharacterized phage-associated protein